MKTWNLNEISLEEVAQWSILAKIGSLFGVLIILVILEYYWFINPTYQALQQDIDQELALKADIETKVNQAATLESLKGRIAIKNQEMDALVQQLFTTNTLSILVAKVSKIALEVGLEIESFTPQDEILQDFYKQIPIKISLKGNYFQLAAFASRLVEKKKILTLKQFIMEPLLASTKEKSSKEQLLMHITGVVYKNTVHNES